MNLVNTPEKKKNVVFKQLFSKIEERYQSFITYYVKVRFLKEYFIKYQLLYRNVSF